MNNDIIDLLKKFQEIKKMGFVQSQRCGTTGIGYTFESLINKPEENFEMPDYNSIEIKTKHKYSKGYITLFNANPDGDILFPIDRLLNNFGYYDKINPLYKKFNMSIYSNKWTKIGMNRRMKLKINDAKINLLAVDYNFNNLNTEISWSFDIVKEKLERKNRILALVKAECKTINKIDYFKYYDIKFYKLKGFDQFINLIKDGTIRITFKISFFKSGKRKGQIHNHGTGFDINEKDLLKLYEPIEVN